MALFELVIVLLLGAAILTTFSQKAGVPYPVLLAVGGVGLALLPTAGMSARLDPDLALVLFVAPVLLDTAYDTSLRDLRANWRPIGSLVIAAVGVTVGAVAIVAHWLVPDLPWAAAIALGAIVAPPDAVAASSVLRQLSPPYRILVILEGESLLNDATALLIYRTALNAVSGHFSWATLPLFLAASLGGIVLGYGLALLIPMLLKRLADGPVYIMMQFVGTFGVWLLAEAVGLSPILTVVAYAMTLARNSESHQGAEARVSSFAVWEVVVYVLNALAFILMGLQLKEIGGNLKGEFATYAGFSAAILLTVILVRVAWVMFYAGWRQMSQRIRRSSDDSRPSFRASLVLGWCGMRGIVTLATALALPYGEAAGAFPHRDLLITAAFGVVLGTLVVQGLTLGPLIRWLDLGDDGMVEREEVLARQESARAALKTLDGNTQPEAETLRREYNFRLQEETPPEETLKPHAIGRLRLKVIRAEREALQRLRRTQRIGDAAFQTVQEELDWAEGHAVHRRRAFAAEAPETDEEARSA